MSTTLFECDVTEFSSMPLRENDLNLFTINNNDLIINLMNGEKLICQTEIEKDSAIKLAKLILMTYDIKI